VQRDAAIVGPPGRSFRKGDTWECDYCLAPIALGIRCLSGELVWLCDRHGERFLDESGEAISVWRRTTGTTKGHVTRLTWRANAAQVREMLEAHRDRIATADSVFGSESVWWREILFDYQYADDLEVDPGQEDIRRAAVAGFRAHQELLRSREGDQVEPFEFAFTLAIITAAMTALTGSKGAAKRLQLELAAGRPLTVCSGTTKYLPKHGVETMVPGCGLVFPDTARAEGGRRSYWLRWCSNHQARKHPERTLLPAHLR
jgi:hypothetical protein